MSTRMTIITGFAIAIGLTLVGCKGRSVDRPSEEQTKIAILGAIKAHDQAGTVKLLNFHKTNGQVQELNGVRLYKMEVECEIEFTRDCAWRSPDNTGHVTFYTNPDMNGYQAKRGETAKVPWVIMFEKTENGWRDVPEPRGRRVIGKTFPIEQ